MGPRKSSDVDFVGVVEGKPKPPPNRKPTYDELVEQVARLEGQLDAANRGREAWFKRHEELEEHIANKAVEGLHLYAENVEWVVNDIAELGVKIGEQFFFLYKGRSLVYGDNEHDDGRTMRWRPVYKREFGECCHPPPVTEYSRDRGERNPDGTYTFGNEEDWKDMTCEGP